MVTPMPVALATMWTTWWSPLLGPIRKPGLDLRYGTAASSGLGSFGGAAAVRVTVPASARGWHLVYALGQSSGTWTVTLFLVT
jgi:hypothetical protein